MVEVGKYTATATLPSELNIDTSNNFNVINFEITSANNCISHYFMFALLGLYIALFLVNLFVFKKKTLDLITIIVSSVFLVAYIVLSFFVTCSICLYAIIPCYIVWAIGTGYLICMTILGKKKK